MLPLTQNLEKRATAASRNLMEASAGLVAGSHNREEIVLIQAHEEPKPLNSSNGRVCEICGDDIGLTVDGDVFVACDDCGFPVCRPCYEYERKEGTQACPQCNTRYKRLKGCPRVEGDDDEEDMDDFEHEFNIDEEQNKDSHSASAEAILHGKISCGRDPTNDKNIPKENSKHHIPGAQALRESKSSYLLNKRVHSYPPPPESDVICQAGSPRCEEEKELRHLEPMDDAKMQQEITGTEYNYSNDLNGALAEETRQPLSRKVPIAIGKISPYRMVIGIRLVVLLFFLRYRIMNPVHEAIGLWLTAVVCEIWFSLSWVLEQLPKWFPIDRETYLDRLSFRYERQGEPSLLSSVDIFVTTADPRKEPPIITANTVLSIIAIDYPVDKLSCYVSDDQGSMLTFYSLSETAEFARKWVPFCKKFSIEPRAPEMYFSLKIDNFKDKVQPEFVKERRGMKREYEEFKVRINALVAKHVKAPPEGWTMQDGTPWPANNTKDHPAMIQAFLGQSGSHDIEGNKLPRLVYVSREKRPGFNHHTKAGAVNALVRVSGVLTNAPFVLNLDYDHYVNNSKALREAMCFLMDSQVGKEVCYVQFPQSFNSADKLDCYAYRNTVFFNINMKGLDGIQGPLCIGTGCIFRRLALYGHGPPKSHKRPKMNICDCCPCFGSLRKPEKHPKYGSSAEVASLKVVEEELLVSQIDSEEKFGPSTAFATSTSTVQNGLPPPLSADVLLKEVIHVISCGYEDKTQWGSELGWIYGSAAEDILTGFKMHCRGWRSIYCMPKRPAFKASAPMKLPDRLTQSLQWAVGSVQIFLSHHCPLCYGHKGGNLKWLERIAYINTSIYPFTSIALLVYCIIPAVCLLTGTFIMPTVSTFVNLLFIALLISFFATGVLEQRWSGVSIHEWWQNEQFWVIGGVSAHLLAVVQGFVNTLSRTEFKTPIMSTALETEEFHDLYAFKWTTLLIPPTTLLIINLVGVVGGLSIAITGGYETWGVLFGKLFFASWVIIHLFPFLKGLTTRQNRTPTIVVIWSVLLASIFSLLWVRIDPFSVETKGPDVRQCGINC